MEDKFVKLIRWVARILSLIPIGVLVLDLFLPHMAGGSLLDPSQRVTLILVVISIFGLMVAWKWEAFGGILSLVSLFLLLFSSMVYNGGNINSVGFFALAIIIFPALLFVICWYSSNLELEAE